MQGRMKGAALMLSVCAVALLMGWHFFSGTHCDMVSGTAPAVVSGEEWTVSEDGILEYQIATPQYNISPSWIDGNSTVSRV